MIARIAATAIVLAVASCSPAAPDGKSTSRQTEKPATGLSKPPVYSVIDHPVGETLVSPTSSFWEALFELRYDDPAIIENFLADVRSRPGVLRTILLESTLSWGCPCPTWVFPFYQDMRELRQVMVLPSPQLNLDPTDFASAEIPFQMTGRFDGTAITGLEWVKKRGKTPPNFPAPSATDRSLQEYWTEPGLVFVVESWCFDKDTPEDEVQWLRDHGAASCNR